jgi:transposase
MRYAWAQRGHRQMVRTSCKRKGDKVFSVIEYFTGRFLYQGQAGRLNSEVYKAFLTSVLEQATQPIMLIQDRARYHTSAAMQGFFAASTEPLTVFQLSSHSPDYNPIEKLLKKVKKAGTHLRYFSTFEALTDKVEHVRLKFANTPAEIVALYSLPPEWAKPAY